MKNTVVFDPIDGIWICRCFQPSVLSKTASSTIFYLWVWKMTFFIFENPEMVSTPGWLYTYTCVCLVLLLIHTYTCLCMHIYVCTYGCMYVHICVHINVYKYGASQAFEACL